MKQIGLIKAFSLTKTADKMTDKERNALQQQRFVFCQALFPEKSVGIPFFQQGIFPVSSGHYASLRMRACSIR